MTPARGTAALLFLLLISLAIPTAASGQVGRIKRAAKKAAEDEVTNKVSQVASDAVRCTLGDKACVEQAKKDGEPVVIVDKDGEPITDENGNPITDPDEAEARAGEPGKGCGATMTSCPAATYGKQRISRMSPSAASREANSSL